MRRSWRSNYFLIERLTRKRWWIRLETKYLKVEVFQALTFTSIQHLELFHEIQKVQITLEQEFPYSTSSTFKRKNNVTDWANTEVMKIQMSTFIFDEDKEKL